MMFLRQIAGFNVKKMLKSGDNQTSTNEKFEYIYPLSKWHSIIIVMIIRNQWHCCAISYTKDY